MSNKTLADWLASQPDGGRLFEQERLIVETSEAIWALMVQRHVQKAELAKNLGIKLVAEGIETPEQAAMMQAMDCDQAQGFLFHPPVDVAAAEAFIDSKSNLAKAA